MNFNGRKMLNYMLLNNCNKYKISDCHYVTGPGIAIFSNLVCVEKALCSLTCKYNKMFPNMFCLNNKNNIYK